MEAKIVRTKKQFKEYIIEMETPVMTEHDFGNWWSYTSLTIMVTDKNNYQLKFYLPTIRYKENSSLDEYEKREKKLKIKYEKWMHEYCGNYCESKLSI